MKTANVPYCKSLTDWSCLPMMDISEFVRPLPTEAKAYGQLFCTDDAILVHLAAEEQPFKSKEIGPLCMPCNDSCLEFFLRPMEREMRYFNFEWNSAGSLYLGIGSGPADLIRMVLREDQIKTILSPEIRVNADGWEIFFQIPYTFIRLFFPDFQISPGSVIYANFYKCGDRLPCPHYLAWNPILREGKYLFHTPQEFGKLVIVKENELS